MNDWVSIAVAVLALSGAALETGLIGRRRRIEQDLRIASGLPADSPVRHRIIVSVERRVTREMDRRDAPRLRGRVAFGGAVVLAVVATVVYEALMGRLGDDPIVLFAGAAAFFLGLNSILEGMYPALIPWWPLRHQRVRGDAEAQPPIPAPAAPASVPGQPGSPE